MAIAKKCDRCGVFYESYNVKYDSKKINGILTLNIDDEQRYFPNKKIDLCPKCKDSFEHWLSNIPEE